MPYISILKQKIPGSVKWMTMTTEGESTFMYHVYITEYETGFDIVYDFFAEIIKKTYDINRYSFQGSRDKEIGKMEKTDPEKIENVTKDRDEFDYNLNLMKKIRDNKKFLNVKCTETNQENGERKFANCIEILDKVIGIMEGNEYIRF